MTQTSIAQQQEKQLKATSMRLELQLYDILSDRAEKHTRSINGEINFILKEYFAQLEQVSREDTSNHIA